MPDRTPDPAPDREQTGLESPDLDSLRATVADLARRLDTLEAASAAPTPTASAGDAGPTPTAGAVDAAPASATSASATEAGTDALAGDDVFWALNGLVDRLGPEGGVVYTGHLTPPGAPGPVSWQMGLTADGLAELDFSAAAESLSALGNPARLSLLQAVHCGATTAAELAQDDRFGTTGQIYHHLNALARAGWLESTSRGHWRIPPARIIPLLTLILIGTHPGRAGTASQLCTPTSEIRTS